MILLTLVSIKNPIFEWTNKHKRKNSKADRKDYPERNVENMSWWIMWFQAYYFEIVLQDVELVWFPVGEEFSASAWYQCQPALWGIWVATEFSVNFRVLISCRETWRNGFQPASGYITSTLSMLHGSLQQMSGRSRFFLPYLTISLFLVFFLHYKGRKIACGRRWRCFKAHTGITSKIQMHEFYDLTETFY